MAEPRLLTKSEEVKSWFDRVRASDRSGVEPITLNESNAWAQDQGAIRHKSGRFFSIIGLTWQEDQIRYWQPFIDQREIGTLGFIARRREEGIDLLVQAKTEPGNVGTVQLAPSCQATASNCERIHGGEPPPYSGYFTGRMGKVISDSLQSEQGTRFFGKLNRNIMVWDDHAEARYDQHCWMPFQLFKQLLTEDFLVNTDARSVLCTTDWNFLAGRPPFQDGDELSRELEASFAAPVRTGVMASVLAALRALRTNAPEIETCALHKMPGWHLDADNPVTMTNGHLSIRHIKVHAQTREVNEWDQPIFGNNFEQVIDLDLGRANNLLQFAFRPCREPGLRAIAELAPTKVGTLSSYVPADEVKISVRQSDEGGRFFRDVARYQIVDRGEARPADGVLWLTLSEVMELMPKGIFNNEARSALSLLLSRA